MLKAVDQGAATRTVLLDAGFKCLGANGYHKTTARTVADQAGVNQALVFYHFGSVPQLLIAALDRSAESRLQRYSEELSDIRDPIRLLVAAQRLHREDVECGHTTVLAELAAAAVANEAIRSAMTSRVVIWLEFTEGILRQVLATTSLAEVLPIGALARGILALQLGADLLARLQPGSDWIDEGLAAAGRLASMAADG